MNQHVMDVLFGLYGRAAYGLMSLMSAREPLILTATIRKITKCSLPEAKVAARILWLVLHPEDADHPLLSQLRHPVVEGKE